MTYYGGKELAASFRTVRENTIKIAEEIPENKYDYRAAPDTRTIGGMLTHIALSPRFPLAVHQNRITDMKQFNFSEMMQKATAEEAKPRTKAEIIALLKDEGETFATFLDSVSESFLAEQVTLPPGMKPPTRTRFEGLIGAKEHEMHHRAQLMTMQRMIGIVPHLTRQMQERMAAMMASQPQGSAQPAAQR
jgi:uncharacterized damage-inducible protein DinB